MRRRVYLIVVLCAVAGTRVLRADDLEPYLADSLEGAVEQIRSEDTSYPLKRLAARHVLRRYPTAGTDALVEFLYHPGAHFNSEVGRMLFQSRLPNSRTEQLVGDIALGRFKWTREQIEAFADAVAWPGNDAALPVLQRMVDERWDTADTARLCIAQVKDRDGPNELLKLLDHTETRSGSWPGGPRRASDVLRRTRWEATNRSVIDPTSSHGIRDIDGLGLQAKNALGWPGNRAMADLYLRLDDATLTRFANGVNYAWSPWSERWEIPAVRTGDPRCLERARKRFTEAVMNAVNPDGSVKPGAQVPNVVAGVESANEQTLEAIGRMLKWVEWEKARAERQHAELSKRRARGAWREQVIMDPAGGIRSQILRALCVNPVPGVSRVVGQYRDDEKSCYFAGLAMLRAGDVKGFEPLIKAVASMGEAPEPMIVYSGEAFAAKGQPAALRQEMEQWWRAHRDDPALADRVTRVNGSTLLDAIIEDLKYWP